MAMQSLYHKAAVTALSGNHYSQKIRLDHYLDPYWMRVMKETIKKKLKHFKSAPVKYKVRNCSSLYSDNMVQTSSWNGISSEFSKNLEKDRWCFPTNTMYKIESIYMDIVKDPRLDSEKLFSVYAVVVIVEDFRDNVLSLIRRRCDNYPAIDDRFLWIPVEEKENDYSVTTNLLLNKYGAHDLHIKSYGLNGICGLNSVFWTKMQQKNAPELTRYV